MNRPFENRWIFIVAILLASGSAIYPAYGNRGAPLFAAGLLVWGLLPLAIAFLLFHLRQHYAAWGWIVAVLAHGYFVVVNVRQSESSTAVLDFLWTPLWNIAIVGPLGALVGVVLARAIRIAKA